ncbi:hypothetical protein M885DRAFT_559671 [Pelagophyceae sp. CCMP2097]|nr:hypothetical protein M885DRAFT_559671 [Pelagophyceae sp. CCMP2097]
MSLGWNTESALLPSKAKDIADKASKAANRGVERRAARDAADDSERNQREALEAKVQLYEQLKATGRDPTGQFLVNFSGDRELPQRDADGYYVDAPPPPPPPPPPVDEAHGGGSQWAWGTGQDVLPPPPGDIASLLDGARKHAEGHAQGGQGHAQGRQEDRRDEAHPNGGVKSQWERTLGHDAKQHLESIRAETVAARGEAVSARSEAVAARGEPARGADTAAAPAGAPAKPAGIFELRERQRQQRLELLRSRGKLAE